MEAFNLKKQSKSDFEDYLYEHNDFDYEKNTNTVLHLYYNDNGHVGTWTKGSCWIFKDNFC